MRFFGFGGGSVQDEAVKQRQEASQRSLQQGGLPLNAIDRLNEQKARQGTPGHFFTSDLSVNELTLVHQLGYEPMGQIMGSSIYHVGWQWMTLFGMVSGEMDVLTQAFYQARHLALGRLQQEATLLGATGVVGVRLERKEYEWGAGMLEFAAIGTAIRENDAPPSDKPPFLSDLSGEDFWMLRQAGFRPVGFAVGNCTYYQIPSWNTQYATSGGGFGGAWNNQELTDFTQAVYNARSLAMSRMEIEAKAVGAEGIVGADVDIDVESRHISEQRTDLILHFTAIGTAVAPYSGRWPLFTVQNTVSLK